MQRGFSFAAPFEKPPKIAEASQGAALAVYRFEQERPGVEEHSDIAAGSVRGAIEDSQPGGECAQGVTVGVRDPQAT